LVGNSDRISLCGPEKAPGTTVKITFIKSESCELEDQMDSIA